MAGVRILPGDEQLCKTELKLWISRENSGGMAKEST
jgi:hypothetical protein